MMDILVPDIYAQSIYTINYEKLKKSGIKCLIIDLDNTIAPINIKEPDRKIKELFNELNGMGFKLIILSNSSKNRVRPFKEHLNVDSSYSSHKPLLKKYQKIMKLYNFKDTQIAAIGDQLFTDILGANRMGFTSILLNPMSNNDYFWTKVNRYFEKKVFKYFEKREILQRGKYYD
jgi:hypothetical protein